MKKPSLVIIFFTVFIDLIGFGIVLPLLPSYARSFDATGFEVGIIMAAYSAMQFLFAPVWGAWSDRIGRRPILLLSTACTAIAYGIFAVGSGMTGRVGFWVILGSRIFAGIGAANITVAQAYIADITPPAERSKKMGLIGMAFGLGFIIGPVLAVVSSFAFGVQGPGWVAASICALNFIFAFTKLPESWQPGAIPAARRARFAQYAHTLAQPAIGFLIITFFLATFGFTCFESTLGLLIQRNFHLNEHGAATTNAALFAFCGIIGAFVQAGPIGRLVKKLGEPKLIAGSLIVFAVSLAPLPFIHGDTSLTFGGLFAAGASAWWLLLLALAGLAIGSGLTRPPLFGLLSNLTHATEQGATLGVAQSAGSLARIFGPLFAGALFDKHPTWPYLACAALALVTGLIAWQMLVRAKNLPTGEEHAPTAR
ncbi:MAG: MFS transporter [Verrucomicrobia bacterium]|nr:MFS transporter [Verrucomicrobiota bacterium]